MSSRFSHFLRSYRRQFYRQRRRFSVSFILFFMAVWIAPDRLPEILPGLPTQGLLLFVLFPIVPLISMHFSKGRRFLEILALADLFFATTGQLFPGSIADVSQANPDYMLGGLFYSVLVVLCSQLVYGRWSDRLPRPKRIVRDATMRSHLELQPLWYGLVPTPGYADRSPDPDVVAIEYTDADRRTVRLVAWRPDMPVGEALVHFDEFEPFSYVRLRLRVVTGDTDPAIEGATEIRMTDMGSYRSIHIRHEMRDLPLRRVLAGWMDDKLGEINVARLAAVECRAANAKSKAHKTKYSMADWRNERETVSHDDRQTARHSGKSGQYRTSYGRQLINAETAVLNDLVPARPAKKKQIA